jgi:hypothetical protein
MGTSTTADVKKLLELAERLGIPATDAINQVRELRSEVETRDRAVSAPSGTRRPAS